MRSGALLTCEQCVAYTGAQHVVSFGSSLCWDFIAQFLDFSLSVNGAAQGFACGGSAEEGSQHDVEGKWDEHLKFKEGISLCL